MDTHGIDRLEGCLCVSSMYFKRNDVKVTYTFLKRPKSSSERVYSIFCNISVH